MEVIISGKRVRLNKANVIGIGGEATVYKNHDLAIKIYHKPDVKRGIKLQAFLSRNWTLPQDKIAFPISLVYDSSGQKILGPAMNYLGTDFEELTSLANKKYRASFLVNNKMVANIFAQGGQTIKLIHQNGLVIGDFNDLNALFRSGQMLFIDVDSWQFDNFPCPVAVEQFLAPELYGIDLSLRPVFRPEHDWYSFAVMLFKSLLLAHPYGGTHKLVKQLTQRAAKKITVFDSQVTYPQIALTPDLLDDDLAHTFSQIFSKGERNIFPLDVLRSYADSLLECKSCKAYYPKSRHNCPVCSAATIIVVSKPVSVAKGISVLDIIRTTGPIVFHKLIGTTIYVVAYENGKAVLYTKSDNKPSVRQELFDEIAGARFEILHNILIVNLPGKTQLLLLDTSKDPVAPITKSETTLYAPSRRAIFRASASHLFRIVGGNLIYGKVQNGHLIERPLRQVMDQQTWFIAKQEQTGEKPTAFGFFQVLDQQLFWLVWEGSIYDNLALSTLDQGETLLDLAVKFSSQSILIRRLTMYQGVNYLRTDIVSTQGQVTYSTPRIKQEDSLSSQIHGLTYSGGKLLHSSDEGVLQEDVLNSSGKTFAATKGFVQEGDIIHQYQNGLLVVKDKSIIYIVLAS